MLLRVPDDFLERSARGEPAVVELISDGSKPDSRSAQKTLRQS